MDDEEFWQTTGPDECSWPQTLGDWVFAVACGGFYFLVTVAIVAVWLL